MTGWRRVKLCDVVSDTDESQSCALRQPADVDTALAALDKGLTEVATK